MKVYKKLFNEIVSLENLVMAWDEFQAGKRAKPDVQAFEFMLEENLIALRNDLISKQYVHGPYTSFYICDPKVRHIHKATVRDRILHHAVFRILNPIFETTFIPNSFSCRIDKGTHKGVTAIEQMLRQASHNYTSPCFALKCDVRKFFDSIDHAVLLSILEKRIIDPDTRWLLRQIVQSFTAGWHTLLNPCGVPIGNLTSQLFANVYMNEFDQFIKHDLKVKYYARYTDDFIIISTDRNYLRDILTPITNYLNDRLKLSLHPKKVSIRKCQQGVDFLGYVVRPHHLLVRNKTKQRMFRKLKDKATLFRDEQIDDYSLSQSLQSYLGALSHASAYHLGQDLQNSCWTWTH
ncbi:MAG: reverse transcriptase/maturase family protein [Candidatus Magasanikbacteria bacterium]